MAEGSCGICLDDLKNPVSTPCGHLHCEKCLVAHVEASSDAITASCPSCRAAFPVALPDLRFVPAKFHRFIIPSVRRVFVDAPTESTQALKANVTRLEERVKSLEKDKLLLMERCESSMAASSKHAEGERDARMESERLKKDMQELRKKYEEVKRRYKAQKETVPQLVTKRKSNQAALDSSTISSSSSASSSHLFRFGEPTIHADRPVLRIPKRPRLLGSPFDPAKAVSVAPLARPAVFKKGRASVLLSLEHAGRRILGTPEERSASSALGSSVGSSGPRSPRSAGPQRSGLPMGDLFSPESNRTLSSSVDFRSGSSVDIFADSEDD